MNSRNMSLISSDISSDENFPNEENRFSQTSWINLPKLSLIELAYKLKKTEQKLFKENLKLESIQNNLLAEAKSDEYEETENSEYFFGIEETAKNALQLIKQTYIDFDEYNKTGYDEKIYSTPSSITKEKKRFGCGWCVYSTNSKSHLVRHSKALHKDKEVKVVYEPEGKIDEKCPSTIRKRHQCDMCQYQTDCRSHLKRHQASVHCKNKSYQCPLCNEEFTRSEKAKKHHFQYHPEKFFDIRNMHKIINEDLGSKEYNQNPRPLLNDNDLINMYLNSETQASLEPENCESMTCSNDEPPNQQNQVLVDEVHSLERDSNVSPLSCSKTGLIRCLKCNVMCKDLWQLRSHVTQTHPCSREHFCKVCPYSTNQQQRLLTHMFKHKEIFCSLCDFSTTNNYIFRLHSQTCNLKKIFFCSFCNSNYNNFNLYKEHMVHLHNDHSILNCSDCQFTCQSSKELNQHLQLHQWKACQVCPFLAQNQEVYSKHLTEVHAVLEEGSWVCSVCNQSQSSLEDLVKHFDSHTPSYFHCNVSDCSFKSLLESSLELHSKYMHSTDANASMPESEINKSSTLSLKQLHQRKSDLVNPSSNKKLKIVESSTELAPPTESVKTTSIPNYLIPEDNTIVVTPTSPSNSKEEPMFCPRCPERAPFVYKRSFQKHLNQHAIEDQSNKC